MSNELIRLHGALVQFRLIKAWGMVQVLEQLIQEELNYVRLHRR